MKCITYCFGKPLYLEFISTKLLPEDSGFRSSKKFANLILHFSFMGEKVMAILVISENETAEISHIMVAADPVENKLQCIYDRYEKLFYEPLFEWIQEIHTLVKFNQQNLEPFSHN